MSKAFKNGKVLKGIGCGCDEEALRIVSDSPKWRPGKLAGLPVDITQTVTIQFKLTDK
jgi:protein TonB